MNSYSPDLRERVVKASQDQTATQAEIGATFGISVSTIQDWLKRLEATGDVAPLPRGHEQPLIKDEQAPTGASAYARAPSGERAYATGRRNTGHNMTLMAGITLAGMTAPFVIEGSVTTTVMETYVKKVLLPTLQAGDSIILDNL